MESFWYVIKVMPGKERKLNEQYNQQISSGKIDNIVRFICPTEFNTVTVKNKKIIKEKVLYSGYLYFETNKKLDESDLKIISTIDGIMGMMGDKTPIRVNSTEVSKILKDEILQDHLDSKRLKFIKGDQVKVLDGPFLSFTGVVSEIKGEKVDVDIKIFGRSTNVSLTLEQIEKL